MEHASKVIRCLSLPEGAMTADELVCAAWAAAVGKRLAKHTRAVKLVRQRLVVEVEDQVWQRQLFSLSRYIVRNLTQHLGPGLVDDVEFRVMPRRLEPQRANRSMPLFDEANGIEDPVLRGIYRASRARAHA